jgi:hypothetical protein
VGSAVARVTVGFRLSLRSEGKPDVNRTDCELAKSSLFLVNWRARRDSNSPPSDLERELYHLL